MSDIRYPHYYEKGPWAFGVYTCACGAEDRNFGKRGDGCPRALRVALAQAHKTGEELRVLLREAHEAIAVLRDREDNNPTDFTVLLGRIELTADETREYEIWVEGYRTNGERGTAHREGSASGRTFVDACAAYAETNAEFQKYYNREHNTHWACRLFDNEADARKAYG